MGQWIVIQGASPADTGELSQRALQAFLTIHHAEPCDRVADGATNAYTFAPRFSPGLTIESNRETGEWAGAAGPLFYGDSGRQEALRNFVRADMEHAIPQLDGAFAIFRRDGNGQIAVITDRLGTMHAYAITLRSATVIATSSMVLAALCEANWDFLSCREFLATGTVFGQRTLFREIEKLAPASIYVFAEGRLKSKKSYWRVADFEYTQSGGKETTERLASSLERVMRRITGCYSRPLLDLTGGLDSRAVLGAAMRAAGQFETTVAGTNLDADVLVSSSIAREYGIVHHIINPSHDVTTDDARSALPLTDGEFDVFEYARVAKIHSCLAQSHDVSVNGSNGEIYRGHWWGLLFPFTGSRHWFPTNIVAARRFGHHRGPELLAPVFQSTLQAHFRALIREANQPLKIYPNTAKMDNLYLIFRMQRWQGRIASSTNRLWPAISPFAFREPLELALTSEPAIRIRSRLARRLIEHFDPKLAAFPTALAPQKAASASIPCSDPLVWTEIRDLLLSSHAATAELYHPGAMTALIQHAWGTGVHGTVVARAVTLEMLAQALKEFASTSNRSVGINHLTQPGLQ